MTRITKRITLTVSRIKPSFLSSPLFVYSSMSYMLTQTGSPLKLEYRGFTVKHGSHGVIAKKIILPVFVSFDYSSVNFRKNVYHIF